MAKDIDRLADEIAENFLPDFRSIVKRILIAGAMAERERIYALIRPNQPADSTLSGTRRPRREGVAGYGAISQPVREALRLLSADTPTGVTAADIAAHFELHGGGPTERQIRAALKQLYNVGAANRADRGRYLAAERGAGQRSGEAPDAPASGSFDQAAE